MRNGAFLLYFAHRPRSGRGSKEEMQAAWILTPLNDTKWVPLMLFYLPGRHLQ